MPSLGERPAHGLPRRGQHAGLPAASVEIGRLEPKPASHDAVGARQAPAVSPFTLTLYTLASDHDLGDTDSQGPKVLLSYDM
eukprot:6213066-Pleurochrysis_carterae.AAC.2